MWFQWFSLGGLILFSFEFFVQFILNMDGEDKICLDRIDPGIYGDNVTCDYTRDNHYGTYSSNGVSRTPGKPNMHT